MQALSIHEKPPVIFRKSRVNVYNALHIYYVLLFRLSITTPYGVHLWRNVIAIYMIWNSLS